MRKDVRTPTIAAAACAATLAIVLALAYLVTPIANLDAKALSGVQALQGPIATPVLNAIAHTADPFPLAAMLVAAVLAGLALGRRRQALVAVGVVQARPA